MDLVHELAFFVHLKFVNKKLEMSVKNGKYISKCLHFEVRFSDSSMPANELCRCHEGQEMSCARISICSIHILLIEFCYNCNKVKRD